MVKQIDELDAPSDWPPLIDHIGWRLWHATDTWKRMFVAGMVAAGHDWFSDARAALLPHLDRTGTRQSVLADRLGVTKQAVQQMIDDLERDGIVVRRPDPDDRRSKVIVFTPKGTAALTDANRVKQQIEGDIRARLGDRDFSRLEGLLRRLAPD